MELAARGNNPYHKKKVHNPCRLGVSKVKTKGLHTTLCCKENFFLL